jgi:prepilin-type N-terminal cleavage/methylation domain-containing protein
MKNKKRIAKKYIIELGFTLIELLVVISIVGLLASVALFSFMDVRIRAQDTRRLTDVQQITKALELYYDDYKKYPQLNSVVSAPGCSFSWCYFEDALKPYLKVPNDPITTGYPYSYYYESDPGDNYQSYGFMITLYHGSNTDKQSTDGGFYDTLYEVGYQVTYCKNKYSGANGNWWGSQLTVCVGGN